MRSLSLCNQKGGVGKTTVTVATAAAAAAAGARVLVIDADPQGHATIALGREQLYSREKPNLATVLFGESPGVGLAELVDLHVWQPTRNGKPASPGRIDLLPACPLMFVVDLRLAGVRGREFRLARLLASSGLAAHYDLCLIDCPPSLGLLTDNALITSREVVIVVGADPASEHGLELLLDQIRSLRAALDVEVAIAGLVVNRTEGTRVSRESVAGFAELGLPILATIPKRVRFQEAWRKRVPFQALEPTGDVAEAFTALAAGLDLDLELTEAQS
jgi:chromosome partitioning protein